MLFIIYISISWSCSFQNVYQPYTEGYRKSKPRRFHTQGCKEANDHNYIDNKKQNYISHNIKIR